MTRPLQPHCLMALSLKKKIFCGFHKLLYNLSVLDCMDSLTLSYPIDKYFTNKKYRIELLVYEWAVREIGLNFD